MLQKISMAFIATALFFIASAQDSTKSLSISGGLDAYYRYNLDDAADGAKSNSFTSFTKSQNGFALGLATIKADASALSGKVTATVDLGFGQRAEEFSYYDFAAKSSLVYVKQLYLTVAATKNLKFTFGKFATHVGYELLDAPLNRNYSMSYMFTNGPFSHTGLKADITAGPVGLMIGVANFIDETEATTSSKTLIAQISGGTKNGKLKAFLNYAGFMGATKGANPLKLKSLNQVDLVVTGTISNKFNIGFNATVQQREQVKFAPTPNGAWFGTALYLNFDPCSKIGLSLRSEYIGDDKLVYFGAKNIFANTLSLNYKVGPVTLIPEVRFETAESKIFKTHNLSTQSSTVSALMAVVYKF